MMLNLNKQENKMDKKQMMEILDNPHNYSAKDRKKAAKSAIELLDNIAENDQPYYHFVMFGNEGLEGYKVVRSESEISIDTLNNMGLRARMNGHRNISVYAFKANSKIEPEFITKELLKKAEKIF